MIAALDVDYRENWAQAACVLFHAFADATPASERVVRCAPVAPYEPGAFYKRELPCLLRVLEGVAAETLVIDGYVFLDGGRPGLGAHLHAARGGVVIGVAKTPYHGVIPCEEVRRGASARPLYVTAAGIELARAAEAVCSMHGEHRIPTLLRRVDRLARS